MRAARETTFSAPRLLAALTAGVVAAGAAILARRAAMHSRAKADGSPVTDADIAAQEILLAHLAELLPGVPVVAEEQAEQPPAAGLDTFVLVDPLDGTREFVAGRDEFTVNVAVIVDGEPAAGIVAAPALGRLWRGAAGHGAERLTIAADAAGAAVPLQARPWPAQPLALTSRSHLDAASLALIAAIPGLRQQPCGSSLKFCMLAEGAADLYPRLAPTMEWDVAAGHAVLAAAGGCVCRPDGTLLRYGSAGFRLPAFIAWGDPRAAARLAPAATAAARR